MQRQVFLSYSREDIRMVSFLGEALSNEGFDVWWDQDIRHGANWIVELDTKLSQVDCVVVVWSADSVYSNYVLTEAKMGLERGILIPVFVEECDLPEPFDQIQTSINLSGWNGGSGYGPFRSLVDCIEQEFDGQTLLDNVGSAVQTLDAMCDEDTVDFYWDEAQNGDSDAQFQIGFLHHYGLGDIDMNPEEALHWYEKSAKQGNVEAVYEIGNLYWGYLEDNETKAVKWFKRAAMDNHAYAAYNIYLICSRGRGVRKNLTMAQEYLELAAELGNEKALEDLD